MRTRFSAYHNNLDTMRLRVVNDDYDDDDNDSLDDGDDTEDEDGFDFDVVE